MSPAEINELANGLVFISIIPFAIFTLVYGFGSGWYHSFLGIVTESLFGSITGVLTFVFLRRLWGTFAGYEWWAIGVYSWLTLSAVAMVVILIVERRESPILRIPLGKKKS